ncbi:methyltransferase [Ornithinibacillus bavariensis]|uniref:Methyltransferase n=1 Tax=Ornithinibacillus bavariensis TaxID=545502 RepID=A0A919X7C8_9BACI|nr:methyltransferase [Ornithinibacillus bavariensis]GIO27321.1 methyltransferase [Ornithinibacillus bavariensis]HAM81929.1 SAM-dependent methyltransferase [Ornithinibacillus sp.]
MKEYYYDKLFNIQTIGKGVLNQITHYYPYEPTPYEALEILVEQYEVKSSDHFVDFGCGLGRLNFFIHYFYQAAVTGIEMNEIAYRKALHNRKLYTKKTNNSVETLQFKHCLAEQYEISEIDNRFYFFNPFSVHIFQYIVNQIMLSVEKAPREVDIILYYPSEDYVFYLENRTAFKQAQEVVVPGLYEKNNNERFLVYRLDY